MPPQNAFVAASDLKLGDDFWTAAGHQAELIDIEIEYAVATGAFTTYNFEVADWHTYFVGADGVWVHNAGKAACQRIKAQILRIMQREGLDEWPAMKRFLEKTATPAGRKATDASLSSVFEELMESLYKKAIRPDGTIDPAKMAKIPSYAEASQALAGRAKATLLDSHHIGTKYYAKKLVPGITDAELDQMPALCLNRFSHRPNELGLANFHQILDDVFAEVPTTTTPGRFANLAEAYRRWDPEFGPIVWKVARQWLASKGV